MSEHWIIEDFSAVLEELAVLFHAKEELRIYDRLPHFVRPMQALHEHLKSS